MSVFWAIRSIIAGRELQTFLWSPEECSVSKNLPALSKASALIKLIQQGENKMASVCWEGIKEDENKRIHYRSKTANPSEQGSHSLRHASPWEAKFKAISRMIPQHPLDRSEGAGGGARKKEESGLTLAPTHPPTHPHYSTSPEGLDFPIWSCRGIKFETMFKTFKNVQKLP